MISRYFTGEYRVRQFGYSSAITNMTLVVATAVTGYLAEVHWRLPFAVYLLPLISLVLFKYNYQHKQNEFVYLTEPDKNTSFLNTYALNYSS